jgi:hypothetical protein
MSCISWEFLTKDRSRFIGQAGSGRHRAIRLMRTKKRLVIATLVCFVGIPLLHAAVPHTFTAGTAAVASEVNANLTYLDEISVPVGGIIGWHKSFANVPALPASGKWVECNGQVLADAGSPLNGQTIPNLNGAAVASLASNSMMFTLFIVQKYMAFKA